MKLYVGDLVRDEGTVVVFSGFDEAGQYYHFAADHRPAQAIAEALADVGDRDDDIVVEVESWQLLGVAR
jgi:hypothetical protein